MGTITVFDAEGNEYEMEVDEDNAGGPPDRDRSPAEWAKLRRAEKAARDRESEKKAAERALAFYRAGINPDDSRMGYFVKGYDGDLSPERIKEAAVSAGFLAADTPSTTTPADPTALDTEVASHQANRAIGAAGAGASPDRRSAVAALVEADERGGRAAIIDQLRAAGVPIQYDSQE